jgi:hypothetical protein
MKRFTFFGLSILTILAAASCGASLNFDIGQAIRNQISEAPGLGWLEPVTDIAATRRLDFGEEVLLEGQVEQYLPLIDQGLYQLADETGAIWVVSADAPPPVGERMKVRASVQYEPILMTGQDVGEHYMQEIARYPQD